MKRIFLWTALGLCIAGHGALAHDYTLGDLTIAHPMAFETSPMAQTAGGFLSITNAGNTPARLIEARADFPRVEIHTTEMSGGVARMIKQEFVEIPPGETVTFAPGGYHVMFMGLGGDPFKIGEKIPATLVFDSLGEVAVEFEVEARPTGDGGMDHSGHGGHTGHGATN